MDVIQFNEMYKYTFQKFYWTKNILLTLTLLEHQFSTSKKKTLIINTQNDEKIDLSFFGYVIFVRASFFVVAFIIKFDKLFVWMAVFFLFHLLELMMLIWRHDVWSRFLSLNPAPIRKKKKTSQKTLSSLGGIPLDLHLNSSL